jgi:phage-related baseplate assembly protein
VARHRIRSAARSLTVAGSSPALSAITLDDAIAQIRAAPSAESAVTLARLLGRELKIDPTRLWILAMQESRTR